ncbi:MAG: hypothetical protein AAF226_14060, partial [Verrucomicrobiota bacterium]
IVIRLHHAISYPRIWGKLIKMACMCNRRALFYRITGAIGAMIFVIICFYAHRMVQLKELEKAGLASPHRNYHGLSFWDMRIAQVESADLPAWLHELTLKSIFVVRPEITGLRIDPTVLNPTVIATLKGWPLNRTQHLSFGNNLLTPEQLAGFGPMPKLESLSYPHMSGDELLPTLLELAPNCQRIDFSYSKVTGENLDLAPHLFIGLDTLDLSGTAISMNGWQTIVKLEMPELTSLSLRSAEITPEACQYIKQLPITDYLSFENSTITVEQLITLGEIESEILDLSKTKLDLVNWLNSSPPHPKIKALKLQRAKVTDTDIEAIIAKFPSLERLELQAAALSAESLLLLKQLPRLEKLDLFGVLNYYTELQELKKTISRISIDYAPLP